MYAAIQLYLEELENFKKDTPSPKRQPPLQPPSIHKDPIDRLETLENENANLRQLLSSLNTVLGQMKLQNPAIKEAPQDHSEQLSILPISWVYDLVREEIEGSLEAISEMIHSHN